MTNRIAEVSPRTMARIAGVGYLIIIVAGIFAEFFVRGSLIVPNDAAATMQNILDADGFFRIGIVADFAMLLCDVLLALALYILFKPVSNSLSLLASFFRLVHAAIYGLNLLNLLFVLELISGADYLSGFSSAQVQSLVLFFLEGHSTGYLIGLVFFGVHCLLLGYLIIRSDFIPGLLGILLIFAAFGYLIDSFAQVLMANYTNYEWIFMIIVFVPAFIAELSFCLWLIFKGVKRQQA